MRIRLSENFRAVFYAPFYATIALGLHAREGIEIELVPSSAPGSAAAAMLEGAVDVTWGGPMRVMKARDETNGPSFVCFCDVVRRDPFYLIGRPRERPFALTDLQYLSVGSVSEVPTPWLCLQHDLRELNIDPTSVRRVSDRSMADNLEALRRRELDVVQVFEPYASMAVREGIGDILFAASTRGPTAYTTFLATRESVQKNRSAFAAMTHATQTMQGWLANHPAAELASVVASYFPLVSPELLIDALERYRAAGLWATDTRLSRQGFERLAVSLQSGGFISKLPTYEDCVVDGEILGG